MTLDDRRFDVVESNTIYLTIVFSTNELPERFCTLTSFAINIQEGKKCMGIKSLRKIWDILSNKKKKKMYGIYLFITFTQYIPWHSLKQLRVGSE